MTLAFPPAPPERRYVVEINEVGIFATRIGVDFWTEHILMRPIADRIHWVGLTPGGGVAQIPCAGKEEAEFFHGKLIEHGIHKNHARVKRITARCEVPGA
jgi:hypothetical protein